MTDVVQFLEENGETQEILTEYEYDELGRLIVQEDANDHRTIYEYDKLGRRTAVSLPEGQRSSTIYDAVGNILSSTDFNGETTTYQYDEQNRQIFIDLPNDPDITLTYTPTGQRETVTDGRGTTNYEYNVRDWLISRTDPTGPYLPNGNTIEYEYDAAGNRTLLTTPSGSTSYSFDEQNRLETVTDSSQGTTTYIYDAVSNLVQTVLPNGVVEIREYDEMNRLEYLENKLGSEVISSYDYELDEVGNRISVTEHDGRKVEYEYDSLYRLVEENITDESGQRVITYTYDKVGNRLSRNDSASGETTYQYNDNDWLLSEQHNGDVIIYEYDNNGNTIKRIKNGTEETVYIWDDQNRLVEFRTPSGDIIICTYDVDNIRVSQTLNGVTTQYIVDKNRNYAQVIEEYVDGELEVRYVHGLDLISQERNEEVSVYLVDGLGSTRGLTDDDGNVTNVYDYDAFGNLITKSGTVENDYQFAGEQYDENLEQYYLRQRYYDAGIGRFTRRDTYEGRLREPITLHKYIYTHANPVNGIDPSGLFTFSIQDLTVTQQVGAILAATGLAGIVVNSGPPENLGGFGEGPQPSIPNHTGHSRDELSAKLSERLGGFGEGRQPDSSHAIVDIFDDLRDLLSSFFSSARDILVPSGQPIGQSGSSSKIREVQGDVDTGLDLLAEIIKSEGGTYTDVTPAGYEGIMIQLLNGDRYGLRDKMNNSPNSNANLDVNAASVPEIKKIKFNP